MRKTLITITMGLALLPQMSKAQVYGFGFTAADE